jgi:hypothetical protein
MGGDVFLVYKKCIITALTILVLAPLLKEAPEDVPV